MLRDGWGKPDSLSAIVTGRGGVGKSDLVGILKRVLSPIAIPVWDEFDWSQASSVDSALKQIETKSVKLSPDTPGILVVIDEAFAKAGHLLLGENGKMLIQGGARCSPMARFLLIDADFDRHRGEVSVSQFLTRIREFLVPALSTRHGDIPYIFGAGCLKELKTSSTRISEAVLLGVINWVLKQPEGQQSPREIIRKAEEVVAEFSRNPTKKGVIPEISKRHLPAALKDGLEETESPREFFQFSW